MNGLLAGDTPKEIQECALVLARLAREEDLGSRDVTSALLHDTDRGAFRLVARQAGVFAGRAVAKTVLSVYDENVELQWTDAGGDGAVIDRPPVELGRLHGSCRTILEAERVLLNFLQHLCGVATLTARYVEAVAGTTARIFDTRKTIPGWRVLDKYAVRCGGGRNHRMGLHDAVLIKDNHLAGIPTSQLAGRVFDMLNTASTLDPPPSFIEVEADSLAQFEELLKVVGIDVVLLDNFSLADLRQAVAMRNGANLKGDLELEASGGITLETVRAVADTGVERISVGQITHSAPALDLALDRVTDGASSAPDVR